MPDLIKKDKIKGLLNFKGKTQKEIAKALNMEESSFNNKMTKGNFTVVELIKIAELTNTTLMFRDEEGFMITFDKDDIKQEK